MRLGRRHRMDALGPAGCVRVIHGLRGSRCSCRTPRRRSIALSTEKGDGVLRATTLASLSPKAAPAQPLKARSPLGARTGSSTHMELPIFAFLSVEL